MSETRFWVLTATGLAVLLLAVGTVWNWVYLERRTEEVGERLLLLSSLRRGALEQYRGVSPGGIAQLDRATAF